MSKVDEIYNRLVELHDANSDLDIDHGVRLGIKWTLAYLQKEGMIKE